MTTLVVMKIAIQRVKQSVRVTASLMVAQTVSQMVTGMVMTIALMVEM